MSTIKGTVQIGFDCGIGEEEHTNINYAEENVRHFLIDNDTGNEIELEDDSLTKELPVGEKIEVNVEKSNNDLYKIKKSNGKTYKKLKEPFKNSYVTHPTDNDGLPDKTLLLLKKVDTDHEADDTEVKEIEDLAKKLGEMWWYWSGGRWNTKTEGYIFPTSLDIDSNQMSTEISNFRQDNNIEGLQSSQVWGGLKHGFCGHGRLCSLTYSPTSKVYQQCGLTTMGHERGHNLCLRHAGKITNGYVSAYGDNYCVMGSGNIAGLNAPMQYYINLHNPEGFEDVTETKEYRLVPLEFKEHERWNGESQILRVDKGNEIYFISRRKYPMAYGVSSNAHKKVFIHRTKNRNERNTTIQLAELLEGESTILDDGIKVRHIEAGRDSSRVAIHYNTNDPTPDQSPEPTEKYLSPTVPLDQSDIGYYYNPKHSGQGYEVFVIPRENKPTQIEVYDYNYNFEGTPQNKWHYCSGHLNSNGVGILTVYEVNGSVKNDIGTARVYRIEEKIHIDWNTSVHGRAHLELEKLLGSDHMVSKYTGIWGHPTDDNSGFTIQARNGRFMAFKWENNGNWYMLDGGESYQDGDTSVTAEFWRTSYGKWNDPREVSKSMIKNVTFKLKTTIVDGEPQYDVDYIDGSTNETLELRHIWTVHQRKEN